MSFIVSVHTKQNLELPWAVVNAKSTQPLWDFRAVEQGYSRIIFQPSDQDLAVTEEGTLTLESPSEEKSHQWKIGQTGGLSVVLESRSANQLLQVDDAGVLSLGQPKYSSTQYWLIEPTEEEHTLPQQQPMQPVVEVPLTMEPNIIPNSVHIAAKRANVLRIVIMVVSILLLIGGLIGSVMATLSMINPPIIVDESGVESQFAPSDFIFDLGAALFTIVGAIFGIISTVNSIPRNVQYKFLYIFIAFLILRVILAAVLEIVTPIDESVMAVVGSMSTLMLINWALFALCVVLPAASCVACAAFRVKYMKVQDRSHIQQVDDSREVEMELQNV